MFIIRDAQPGDLPQLLHLARLLDTVNLPAKPDALEELVDLSVRAFSGRSRDPSKNLYLLVLEDTRTGALAGTSQIIAQHGTRDAPHIFFEVFEREHYSRTIDRHFRHQVMRIGYNYDGYTEIGGLVVSPEYRGFGKPGKQLSFARFLYIAMHRTRFRDRLLAELLPPLDPDGANALWRSLGARFTGISYAEADKLSRENKEFIQHLFPTGEIYVELLPPEVQAVVGKVGPATEPVRRMLEQVGFRYDHRIDPFDGGPHYSAPTADVRPVQAYRKARLQAEPLDTEWTPCLVGVERPSEKPRFRVVQAPCRIDDDRAYIPTRARSLLGAEVGERLHVTPFVFDV